MGSHRVGHHWSDLAAAAAAADFLSGKESACKEGDLGLIPGLGRSPGEGKGYPLQYSGLENSMDCIVHEVAKSQIRLSDWVHTCTDVQKSCINTAINPYIHTVYQIHQFHHIFKNHTCFVLSVSLFFFSEPFESKLQILCSLTPTYFIWCLLRKAKDILLHHFSKRIKINIDTVSLWNWYTHFNLPQLSQ